MIFTIIYDFIFDMVEVWLHSFTKSPQTEILQILKGNFPSKNYVTVCLGKSVVGIFSENSKKSSKSLSFITVDNLWLICKWDRTGNANVACSLNPRFMYPKLPASQFILTWPNFENIFELFLESHFFTIFSFSSEKKTISFSLIPILTWKRLIEIYLIWSQVGKVTSG